MGFITDRMEEVYREIELKSHRGETLTEDELALASALGVVQGMQALESRRVREVMEEDGDTPKKKKKV